MPIVHPKSSNLLPKLRNGVIHLPPFWLRDPYRLDHICRVEIPSTATAGWSQTK
jgi:hypothetical protein